MDEYIDVYMLCIIQQLYFCVDFSVPNFGDDVIWQKIDPSGQSTGTINYLQIMSPTAFSNESSYNFNNGMFWSSLPINEPQSGRTV